MNKRLDKYIRISEVDDGIEHKTKKFIVWNIQRDLTIGEIKWYGGWRKYVYYNYEVGFMDWDFMRMMADFCEQQTKDHYSI